jgi:hypothetical protein
MRRLLAGALAATLVLGGGAAFAGQGSKTVRGTVTAVGPDSVTVKVADKDVKFGVDGKTMVTVRGGGTATKEAKAQGKSGPAVSSVVKEGQTVEVHYSETGMVASSITVLPAGASTAMAPPKPAETTTSGQVTAMTGTSLTLKTSAGESTYTVSEKTHFVGVGLGTQSRDAAAAGKKQVLSDVVGIGDTVSVTWEDAAGAKHASSVHVREKAKK